MQKNYNPTITTADHWYNVSDIGYVIGGFIEEKLGVNTSNSSLQLMRDSGYLETIRPFCEKLINMLKTNKNVKGTFSDTKGKLTLTENGLAKRGILRINLNDNTSNRVNTLYAEWSLEAIVDISNLPDSIKVIYARFNYLLVPTGDIIYNDTDGSSKPLTTPRSIILTSGSKNSLKESVLEEPSSLFNIDSSLETVLQGLSTRNKPSSKVGFADTTDVGVHYTL